MTSVPHTHILAASTALIGDPPLRSLRFVRLFDDIDDMQSSRQRVRIATRPVPSVRYGRMSRVAFVIPAGGGVEHRIEVDGRIVQPSEVRCDGVQR